MYKLSVVEVQMAGSGRDALDRNKWHQPEQHLGGLLRKHFNDEQMALIGKESPEALKVWRSWKVPRKKKRIGPGFIRRLLKR